MISERPSTIPFRTVLTLFAMGSFALTACGRSSPSSDGPAATAPPSVLQKLKEVTTEGYDLKRSGDNRDALGKFLVAEKLIRDTKPLDSYQLASNLDDQASVYLRLGESDRAKKIYEQAAELLVDLQHPRAPALRDGVNWRLRIHQALERNGISCRESNSYDPAQNEMRPYFPAQEELLQAVGRLNPKIRDCFQGKAKPVTVSLVLTGEGQIVLSDARGSLSNKSPSLCAAERLLKLGEVPDFPKFGACFRPLTYPFVVGGL